MTGSTLYRRLPNGSWAAEREDAPGVGSPEAPAAANAAPAPPADSPAAAAPAPPADSPVAAAPASAAPAVGASASVPPTVAPAAAAGAAVAASGAATPGAGAGVPAGGATPPPPPPAPPAGPRATPPPPPPRSRARRRWGFWRILRWAVAAYLAWLVALMAYLSLAMPSIDALSSDPIPDTDGSVWLLVGSDSREGLTAEERSDLVTGDESGQRTDTIMLVHMAAGSAPTLISIPRDSWVTIPAHTSSDGSQIPARGGKVNAAYAYGGAPLLSETIEYNTGLRVDHYVEIGFGGIVSLTDAVGGIEACFDTAIDDRYSGLDVKAGCHVLDGKDALAYVRMRYADPRGDLGRIERQQHFVSEVIDGVLSVRTAISPARQLAIVNATLESVTVDEGTGVVDLGRFGLGMARIATGRGEVTVVPIDDSDHREGGQWVIHWDDEQANRLFASLGGSVPQAASEPPQE